MNKNSLLLPNLAGIFISFIFGFSFLFSKQSLSQMTPFELLAHRFSLASIVMLLLYVFRIIKIRLSWALFLDLLPLAFFQPVLYFVGETYGVKLTSASESGLIISLIPVAVTIMAILFLQERIGFKQWVLIILSVLGVACIIFAGSGKYQFNLHLLGLLALLLAVTAAAAYNILARKLSGNYRPIEITFVMMVVGALFFNLIRLFSKGSSGTYFNAFFNSGSLIALLYLGVLSSVGAFFLMNYMLNRMPAFKVATFVNLTTIISVFAGVFFRGESFGWWHIIGSLLILISVWGINAKGGQEVNDTRKK